MLTTLIQQSPLCVISDKEISHLRGTNGYILVPTGARQLTVPCVR
jgi:hypothetical protein